MRNAMWNRRRPTLNTRNESRGLLVIVSNDHLGAHLSLRALQQLEPIETVGNLNRCSLIWAAGGMVIGRPR